MIVAVRIPRKLIRILIPVYVSLKSSIKFAIYSCLISLGCVLLLKLARSFITIFPSVIQSHLYIFMSDEFTTVFYGYGVRVATCLTSQLISHVSALTFFIEFDTGRTHPCLHGSYQQQSAVAPCTLYHALNLGRVRHSALSARALWVVFLHAGFVRKLALGNANDAQALSRKVDWNLFFCNIISY